MKRFVYGASLCALVLLVTGPHFAHANGFQENRAWQFDTASQKNAKAGIVDLIERKKGGFYDSFSTTNNYNTFFDGHQINCNVSASAVGNTGSNDASGQSGNANITPEGEIVADAAANTGSNSFTASKPVNAQAGNDSWTGSQGDDNTSGGSASGSQNAGHTIDSEQSVGDNSPQNAMVSDPNISSDVGSVDTSGTTDVALNSSQTNTESPQSASIDGSEGCRFIGAPTTADGGL
ncbi:hypothetical protein [Arhodomonas sp. SL1]|uniref:hypothetical protein n=1 Tax=Arhodomonas sp. SL1 TaxID=3425691 RepID=UPI003F885B9E